MYRKQLMLFIIVLLIGSINVYGASTPGIYLNDVEVLVKTHLGEPFINDEGVMYVPLEGFMQYYGTQVHELEDSEGLGFTKNAYEMEFVPEMNYYIRNGFKIPLTGQVIQIDGNFYIPIRSFMESLGHQVTWDTEQFSVRIASSDERIETLRKQFAEAGRPTLTAEVSEGQIIFGWQETSNADYYMLYLLSEDWEPMRAAKIIFPKTSDYYRSGYFDASSMAAKTSIYFRTSAVIEGVESELSDPVEVFLK